jgi:predicted RND superfamily exporter protein
MMAILSEVLVVALSGVPFTTATIYLAFELSIYMSTGILAAMIVTIVAVLVWTMKRGPRSGLPKVPETLAEVFCLLSDAQGRKALRELYDGTVGGSAGRSRMRFRLHKQPGKGVWSISEAKDVDDLVV